MKTGTLSITPTPSKRFGAARVGRGMKIFFAASLILTFSGMSPFGTPRDIPTTGCGIAPPVGEAAVKLTSYRAETFRQNFNRASNRVRVVALLSPTCGACQHGQRVVQTVFSKFSGDERLRGFVVWLPMLSTDSEEAAANQAAAFTDRRLRQEWDGKRSSGTLLARTLKLQGPAWDVYLLYAPGVKWTGENPPQPTFWMHQLRVENGADQKMCLNPGVFVSKVRDLLTPKRQG
jgi:hypothetical protein